MTFEQLLVQSELLSPMQLAVAERDAQMRHKRLAPTLIDLGLIDEKRFADWMSETTRLPVVDPLPDDAVLALQRRLPRALAREYEVVPVRLAGNELTVATINPMEAMALEVLHTTTGLKIQPVIARYSELQRLVAKLYPEDDVEPTILPMATTGDESPGMTTQIVQPVRPESQLDRIQQQISAIAAQIDALQKKVDAIDAALSRVLPSR